MSDEVELSVMMRPYETADHNFVLNAWVRSYRAYLSYSPDQVYYPNMQEQVSAIMQRPQARCVVACDESKPEFIFGFCVGEALDSTDFYVPLLLHYTFVKLAYRRLGIARQMAREYGWHSKRAIQCSFWTRFCKDNRERLALYHNDFAIRGFNHGREFPRDARGFQDTEDVQGVGSDGCD